LGTAKLPKIARVLVACLPLTTGCGDEAAQAPLGDSESPAMAILEFESPAHAENPEAAPEDDGLAAERAALEKQRAELVLLRAKVARIEAERAESKPTSGRTRRTGPSRSRSTLEGFCKCGEPVGE
jgi:hypothetical protein